MGGPEIGGFVIHGDFGDPYMNGVLGKFDRGLGGHWEMVFVLMRTQITDTAILSKICMTTSDCTRC
jgi:hypothetical protein